MGRWWRTAVAVSVAAAPTAGCMGAPREATPRDRSLSPEESALASSLEFDASALEALKAFGEGEVTRLRGMDERWEDAEKDGAVVAIAAETRESAVRQLRERLGPQGYGVYSRELNYGYEPDRIALVRHEEPWTYLEMVGTNGINYGVETPQVLDRLRDWDRRFGIDVLGASFDWVELRLESVPEDLAAFAREVYEFCPDTVDQGVGDLDALAREIEKGMLFLWWD